VGAASGWLICNAIPEATVAAVIEPEPEAAPPPPPPPPPPAPRARVVLRGVNFDFDSAAPMEGSQVVLDIAAETLLGNLEVLVRVEGYTDATGPAEYNRDLSRRRAEVVRDMLIKAGIEAERLRVVAHGEDQPLATNETADGRRINRRVQLVTEE
jgi:OOP family OmpA-OmpF porin